jgi:hypothetical protein
LSGGSYDYIYRRLENECTGRMEDKELNALIDDLVPLLKSLEWWKSGDSSEEGYRQIVKEFKTKWLRGECTKRLEAIIIKAIDETKKELLEML